MNQPSRTSQAPETEDEYRAIEAALLETARGRWFLSEHGRRARRLDSALLEDAIGRLQTSLRQPPALLGQLQSELSTLKTYLDDLRTEMLSRSAASANTSAAVSDGPGQDSPHRSIIKDAEALHEIAWALQANPFDPKGCEQLARNAARLYTASQHQALFSERMLAISAAIASATAKIDAMLETVGHEARVDSAASA